MDARREEPALPSSRDLEELSARLRREYQSRFEGANINLVIGRVRSMISRGIGIELNGDWHSFRAARWSPFRRRWVVQLDVPDLERAVRNFLETKVSQPI